MAVVTDWQDLPEGLYAIVDPHDPAAVSYWRRKDTKKRHGGTELSFAAWPPKARYGPVLMKRDVPAGLYGRERGEFLTRWLVETRQPYDELVIGALLADPVACRKRFADLTSRCCDCARVLTDDLSKTYGIGPECRAGISAEVLAQYYSPALGRAHAEHLTQKEDK